MIGTPAAPIPFLGAFESTYQPIHDRDVLETTQHDLRWRSDLNLLAACQVRRLRYPLRWHRIEPEPGRFDWAHIDEVMGFMHDRGLEPVVDLLHHTSYPRWLGDLSSPDFGPTFLRFAEAVAERYPWIPGYTVCNEPFTTFLLCGQVGVWPPHRTGLKGFVELAELLGHHPNGTVWLYTPMALDLARTLLPSLLVYDVMDDLAAFRWAPPALVLRQRQALREADIVFTGGRSLHRSVADRCAADAHCFPSGVEPEHYATAERWREEGRPSSRPVAGYVGVIDERIDLDLLAGVAAALPDWEIRMVGPVLKVDPEVLPQAPNITYPGSKPYDQLPRVMAGFDVALMPFALNEATHAISPTKTLEYLAAGLPVVSTRIPDVVTDYTGIVELRDDGVGLAEACIQAADESREALAERVRPILHAQH